MLAVGLATVGCRNPFTRFRPTSVNVPPTAMADDDDHASWAVEEPFAIVVRKSCRTLDVYRYGQRVRSYPAVFGLNGQGRKVFEGDLRTPTGLYSIVDTRPHSRWRYFMLIDYPNVEDLHRWSAALESGDLPIRGDGPVGPGGAIGIHGTDKPGLNERGVDWTFGCISLQNVDIEDLATLIPIGTLVLIQD